MNTISSIGEEVLRPLVVIAAAIAIGLVIHTILFSVTRRLSSRTESTLDDALVRRGRGATRTLVLLIMLELALPLMELPPVLAMFVPQLASILVIVVVAWLVIAMFNVGQDLLAVRWDLSVPDNLEARKIHTQYDILRKLLTALTILLAIAFILMTFDQVRRLGAGILASAGIVGIIIGLAAQKTLATLFAGIQIALTQPIRIDDVVIVESEWGRIEEITLTYVVVRIWDQRRLIVPITYFIEKPFQNWTRISAELLGTVFLYVDHTVPVPALREELQRIVADDKRWDGRVAGTVVTNTTERTIEVRALISAADSSQAWDLRCHVREKLVAFVRENYPEALPRLRAEVSPPAAPSSPPTRS